MFAKRENERSTQGESERAGERAAFDVGEKEALVVDRVLDEGRPPSPLSSLPDFKDRIRRSPQVNKAQGPNRCRQVIGGSGALHAWCIRGERACPKPSSAAAAAAAAAALTASPSATATATAATCPPCPRRHRRRRREPPTWAAHPCQVRSGRTVGAGCSSCCGASRRSEGRRTSGRTAIGSRAAAVAGGVSTDSEIRAPEIIAGEDRRADITVRKENKSAVHLFVLMASEFKDGRKEGRGGGRNKWRANRVRVAWENRCKCDTGVLVYHHLPPVFFFGVFVSCLGEKSKSCQVHIATSNLNLGGWSTHVRP